MKENYLSIKERKNERKKEGEREREIERVGAMMTTRADYTICV